MILHNDASFKVYFGDAKDDCVKSDGQPNVDYFQRKLKELNIKKLVFLKQTHSNVGLCIDSPSMLDKDLILFEQEGDFIITNQRNIGVGILTADCMPVVFYDPVFHVIAIAHIGWKGAVSKIVKTVLDHMKKCFRSEPENINVYFGPSAKFCCYQINPDFIKNLENCTYPSGVIVKKEDGLYLDLPKLVKSQLIDLGVKPQEINTDYNSCTICDLRFHSYRRSDRKAGRQSTIAILK